jgi:hypothetical protein
LRVGACCTNSRLCSSPNLVWSALLLATGCNWLASSVMLVGHHQASESKDRLLCFPFLVRAEAAQGEALALAQAAELGVFLPNHFVEIRRSHLLVGVMLGGRLQANAWMDVGAHARRHIVCLGLAMQAQSGCLLETRPLQNRPTKVFCCVLCTSSQVDGFQKLGGAAAASLLRGRVRITFVDDEGEREAGVVSELWLGDGRPVPIGEEQPSRTSSCFIPSSACCCVCGMLTAKHWLAEHAAPLHLLLHHHAAHRMMVLWRGGSQP